MPFPSYEGNSRDGRVIDLGRRPRRRWVRFALLAAVLVGVSGAALLLSWYVDALWFDALGFSSVFWKTLGFKASLFTLFTGVTFVLLGGVFWAIRPRDLAGRTILINNQPVTFSLGPVVTAARWVAALVVALVSGSTMMEEWTTFALFWNRPAAIAARSAASAADPIFGRPSEFYLFTLPAWQLVTTWLSTLAVIVLVAAVLALLATEGEQVLTLRRGAAGRPRPYGPVSFALSGVLLVMAARVFLSRFDRLFAEHTIFSGVTYTDAHVVIPGLLWVSAALVAGSAVALVNGFGPRRLAGLIAALLPMLAIFMGVRLTAWYVNGFIVKPNELVRERPYIAHNIAFTSRAFGLDRVEQRAFPAETGIEAIDLKNNQATMRNIRLWDWRALQDTLRQIQEIRTYYDFPDIDIDRYRVGGETRQMMVAARELNIEKLPESSRNWINEKLIYTHGYGVTMNPVDGFTPEGLPKLVLSDMPVESTIADLRVTRPEIYFGQLTSTDVYVRTRQKEFNYPQGESNSYTTYEGSMGIQVGSMPRRLLLALSRGDLSKLPFSDDVNAGSLLLMRRNIHERVSTLAPFLIYDEDPYIVVGRDGRLYWLMDAFTTAETFPCARHYRLGDRQVNYIRNSVKVVVDAYEGAVAFYVFDPDDPIAGAYRRMFPALFRDASAMPAGLGDHVRYPELLLTIQGAVFSLYHMQNPEVFYNREDLWTVANEVTMTETREPVTRPLDPNFVLMQLPGEAGVEFIGILPFTPSNRNNLIGWIAGRSDGKAYGSVAVFDFPKTRLVDGPLQVEARIDQDPQISSQLTLWTQQGSHARRGGLLVIPIGRGLLYAEPIYLQAERSPMPQLRLVVLALQDRLGFGATFDEAMASLFGAGAGPGQRGLTAAEAGALAPDRRGSGSPEPPAGIGRPRPGAGGFPPEILSLLDQAARDLADYQKLTAQGRLGEAGQKLESLKRALDELKRMREGR
jgi:uncharacterized protein